MNAKCEQCNAPAVTTVCLDGERGSFFCAPDAKAALQQQQQVPVQAAPVFDAFLDAWAPEIAPTPAAEVAPADTSARARFWIDAVFEQGLDTHAIAFYVYLRRRAGKSLRAWPSIVTSAKACRTNTHRLVKARKDLADRNMVTWENRFHDTPLYTLTLPEQWVRVDQPTVGRLIQPKSIGSIHVVDRPIPGSRSAWCRPRKVLLKGLPEGTQG